MAALDPALDAVILDVMMPDISGIETLQRIRATSSVPVIMLTARGSEDDRADGIEIGADDYIAKPYYARELLARLNAVLRRQHAASQSHSQHLVAGRLRVIPAKREVTFDAKPVEVTTTEFDLLEALMRSGSTVATGTICRSRCSAASASPTTVASMSMSAICARNSASSPKMTMEIETIRAVGYRLRMQHETPAVRQDILKRLPELHRRHAGGVG